MVRGLLATLVVVTGCGRIGFDATQRVELDPQWMQRYGANGTDETNAIARDPAGNVYVAGSFQGTIDLGGGPRSSAGNDDVVVASFDRDGNHRYSTVFGGTGETHPRGLLARDDGSVWVCGEFGMEITIAGQLYPSGGGNDAFLAHLDPSGVVLRGWTFGATGRDRALGIVAVDEDVVLVFDTSGSNIDLGGGPLREVGVIDLVVARFGQDGTHRWSRRFGGPGEDLVGALATDASGAIYFAGTTNGDIDFGGGPLATTTAPDAFVAKLDASGAHAWSLVSHGAAIDSAYDLAVTEGHVIVVGEAAGTIDLGGGPRGPGGLVFSLTSDGAHEWSRTFGLGAGVRLNAVAADGTGHAIVAGSYQSMLDLALADGSRAQLPHVAGQEIVVVDVGPSGTIWGALAGVGIGDAQIHTAALLVDQIYVGGSFGAELSVGDLTLTSAGMIDGLFIGIDRHRAADLPSP